MTLKTANLAVKAVNLAVKAVNFGSQGGSQGGGQDVVEEWLKEDEHRDGVEKKKEKCGTHQRWCVKKEKIDK